MDWNELKYFLAVADAGSLTQAAEKLNISHSTIFRRIQTFENEMGVRLFNRVDRRYLLTPSGEELLEMGKDIHRSFEEVERHIMGKDLQPKGLVRVSAQSYITSNYLTVFLAEFHRLYPEVEIELISENYAPNLSNMDVDVAVRVFPDSPPDYLLGRKACMVHWSLYASKEYIDKHGHPQTIEDLSHHHLIGAATFLRDWPGFRWLDENYSSSIKVRCNELNAMRTLASNHHGIAFLPDDKRDHLIRIMEFPMGGTASLWVLTHPDLRKVKRINLVMRHLVEKFSALNL